MMLSNLKLVVLIFNSEKGCHQILSLKPDSLVLPWIELEQNLDIDQAILHKLSRHLELVGFPSYKIIDINIKDSLDIYYFCFVNHNIGIKNNSYLLELDQYNEDTPNIKKIIMGI